MSKSIFSKWRPEVYSHELWSCELKFRFPVVKLLDFDLKKIDLEKSKNPFAIAVYTHMKAMATQKDIDKRLEFKKYIARALYKANFDSQTIRELFRFLDWIMTLPEDYECAYVDAIDELEEKMRYVTTFERRGIAKGLEKGIEQGLEKGREEGREEGITANKTSLNTILQARFERVPVKLTSLIENINDLETLKNLVIKAALAESLDEFSDFLATVARENPKKPDVKKVSEPAAAYKTSKPGKKAPTHCKGG